MVGRQYGRKGTRLAQALHAGGIGLSPGTTNGPWASTKSGWKTESNKINNVSFYPENIKGTKYILFKMMLLIFFEGRIWWWYSGVTLSGAWGKGTTRCQGLDPGLSEANYVLWPMMCLPGPQIMFGSWDAASIRDNYSNIGGKRRIGRKSESRSRERDKREAIRTCPGWFPSWENVPLKYIHVTKCCELTYKIKKTYMHTFFILEQGNIHCWRDGCWNTNHEQLCRDLYHSDLTRKSLTYIHKYIYVHLYIPAEYVFDMCIYDI